MILKTGIKGGSRMKNIKLILVSLLAMTVLMMLSCAKEQWGVDERPETIAQSGTPSGAEGEVKQCHHTPV